MEDRIPVVVVGLPGNMASAVANEITNYNNEITNYKNQNRELFDLWPISLSSKRHNGQIFQVNGKEIQIYGQPDKFFEKLERERYNLGQNPIIVDYTTSEAVKSNIENYINHRIPFIIGTTGGEINKNLIKKNLEKTGNIAIIAPNMAIPIVGLQKLMENFANKNPNLMERYNLSIFESHQETKKDTSGTAKAMVGYFNRLGIPFKIEDIERIRDRSKQLEIGVPEEYLDGHGWHFYKIQAPLSKIQAPLLEKLYKEISSFYNSNIFNGYIKEKGENFIRLYYPSRNNFTSSFGVGYCPGEGRLDFNHKINGRHPYAEGTLEALRFLDQKIKKEGRGLFDMINVINWLNEGKKI